MPELEFKRLPQHVAIIMDGNGRWARRQLKNRLYGHKKGAEGARQIVTCCRRLGIPCLTLRENTERPITVEQGTNTMVGSDRSAILRGVDEILAGGGKCGRIPEFWDGHAAERIAADLAQWLIARHLKMRN